MYATASDYLGIRVKPQSTLIHETHPARTNKQQLVREHFDTDTKPESSHVINMDWREEHVNNTADPKVWGPAYWFSLHNSAAHYPHDASPLVRERMKGKILAIPYDIPCAGCRPHASAFVEAHRSQLDDIVSGRHKLGRFYVKFHNKVNARYGKPEWTYEQAYKFYSGGAKMKTLKYN